MTKRPVLIIENDEPLKTVKSFFDQETERMDQRMKFIQKQAEDLENDMNKIKKQFFADVKDRLNFLKVDYDEAKQYLQVKDGVVYVVDKQKDGLDGMPDFLKSLIRGSFED